MGQPSSPTIYTPPTKSEQDANKLANQQKVAALTKINQAIRGESMGLRGMGGLYDWAGPTPWLAGDPRARAAGGGGGAKAPSTKGGYTVPPGYNQPGSVVPGYGPSKGQIEGPAGTGGPALVGGGAPRNTDAVPGVYQPYPSTTTSGGKGEAKNQPVQFFQTAGYQGGPKGDRDYIKPGQPGTYTGNVYTPKTPLYAQKAMQQLGVKVPTQGNAPTPAAFSTGSTPYQRQQDKLIGVTPKVPGRLPLPPGPDATAKQMDVYGRAISQVEGGAPVTVASTKSPAQQKVLSQLGVTGVQTHQVTGQVGVQPAGAQPAGTQPTVAQTAPAPAKVSPSTPAVSVAPTAGPIVSPAPPAKKTAPTSTGKLPILPKPSLYASVATGGAPRNR